MEGGLCYFHANPDKASELSQRGGRAKDPLSGSTLPKYVERSLKTVGDVTSLLADTMNDLRSGRIDARLANKVGFLASGTLKASSKATSGTGLVQMEALLSSNKTPCKQRRRR